jgi:hypothetical protein
MGALAPGDMPEVGSFVLAGERISSLGVYPNGSCMAHIELLTSMLPWAYLKQLRERDKWKGGRAQWWRKNPTAMLKLAAAAGVRHY